MTKYILVLATLLNLATLIINSSPRATAQAVNGVIVLNPVGPASNCAWPAGSTTGDALCPTTTGWYGAVNGGAFTPLGGTTSLSFSQITGSLAATQLPPKLTCKVDNLSVASTGNTIGLSSCQ